MNIASQYMNIGYLDNLSCRDTFVHRLDTRVKIVVTLMFVILVVSFPKYSLSGLLPFFLYPVFLIAIGEIPSGYIIKKIAVISPFAICIGIFNPLFDREIVLNIWGFGMSGGWVSFLSIIVKFVLTVSTALLLIATSSFAGICESLRRMRFPDVFVVQLYFLYRYLFVLLEEGYRMVRARESRSFGKRGYGFRPFISLLSVLLMRTVQRAERIYGAMMARGYGGKMAVTKKFNIRFSDIVFGLIFVSIFLLLRMVDIPGIIGRFLTEGRL